MIRSIPRSHTKRNRRSGEKVVACVVARAPVTAEQVKRFCAGKLAGYKVPKDVIVMDDLPKNETGKVVKRELRERLVARPN